MTAPVCTTDDLIRLYSGAATIPDLDAHLCNTEHDLHVLSHEHRVRAMQAYLTRRARLGLVGGNGERGA